MQSKLNTVITQKELMEVLQAVPEQYQTPKWFNALAYEFKQNLAFTIRSFGAVKAQALLQEEYIRQRCRAQSPYASELLGKLYGQIVLGQVLIETRTGLVSRKLPDLNTKYVTIGLVDKQIKTVNFASTLRSMRTTRGRLIKENPKLSLKSYELIFQKDNKTIDR